MAPSPKKIEEYKAQTSTPAKTTPSQPKKINCFAMDQAPRPGLVPVSTGQIKDGCFVLAWQPQQVSMMVSDAPQWYSFAGKILKANLIFSAIFACALVLVVVLNRVWR